METKPFSMQSPEQIAKDYGGNKQKIAEAMQMGVLDPTAGTLAGMFIDRMRSAAQQEAAPQQSVAQQVFAPPAPPPMAAPAGLGATPEAAAMPPMNAAPPMGAAPPQEMPAMAEGGMVPPYASGGGLSDIPVPDGMFDEPSNGGFGDGYAGGGMVAFFEGGPVKNKPGGMTPEEEDKWLDSPEGQAWLDSQTVPPASANNAIVVSGEGPAKAPIPLKIPEFSGIPTAMYGMTGTPKSNLAAIKEMAPQQTKYSERLTKELEKSLDEKEQKNRARENLDMAMIRAGVAMANAPGSILQAATAGIGAGLPGFEAGVKEQRAEVRDAVKSLAEQEGVSNKAAREAANLAMEMTVKYGTLAEAMKDRAVQIMLAERSDAVQLLIARMTNATQRAGQLVSLQAAKVGAYAPTGTERIIERLGKGDFGAGFKTWSEGKPSSKTPAPLLSGQSMVPLESFYTD
jgi:hypothetical protein